MSGALHELQDTPFHAEALVRKILTRMRRPDRSTAACKAFVRELIRAFLPTWMPGDELPWEIAWRVGEAFETMVAAPHPKLPTPYARSRRTGKHGTPGTRCVA